MVSVQRHEAGDGDLEDIEVTLQQIGGEETEVNLLDLYERYDPMTFFESSKKATKRLPLFIGGKWSLDGEEIAIHDIGYSHRVEYVRFPKDGKMEVLPVEVFFEEGYEPVFPPAPCEEDDSYVGLDDDIAYKVSSYDRAHQVVVLKSEEDTLSVSYEELHKSFRKLEILSIWEILDDEDDD